MDILQIGDNNEQVKNFQKFLVLQGCDLDADGDFGQLTAIAVRAFQAKVGVRVDTIIGDATIKEAVKLGFVPSVESAPIIKTETDYPAKPNFKPLVSTAERQRVFGSFDYRSTVNGNIKILGDWSAKNIIKVTLPQIIGKEIAPKDGGIYFHKLGAEQLRAMFDEWEREGLHKLILTWAGSFVPRFQRGSNSALSNHAFGTAFDINAAWNGLGKTPARPGKTGSVCELVPIAHKYGFYWGGHFSRPDAMHFEIAKIL